MPNDQRVNMQMQVEDVKRAIAQETDPQKKLELAQHGTAYLDDLAKQNPEAYQSVLQANRRQGQAQQGQGGSILQPANPEDGLVDNIRQSRAKSSGMTEQQFMEYRKKVDAAKAQQTQYPQQEVAVPIDPAMLRDQIEAMRRIGSEDERAKQVALLNNPTSEREPVVQQGIFDRIGSGLKSVGRGMGQYTDKLFNDPSRMAMLQGGLSMMNPNSYYDKQGFGNVFQGLETGLGQAQKGMKGVLDRRALSAKTALDKLGGKKTYKTFTETNTQGNPVKINYELDGRGGRKEISRSNITKLVSGINDKGELAVQQFDVTTGDLRDVVVKKGINPIQAQKYLSLIDQVEDWDEALKKYPYSASEIPGKGFDMVNLIVESFFRETPIEGRAKIETMKAQLKPLITPEILKDSRISQAEWEMIDAFLGNGMLSSGLQKERAVPAILKLLRIGGGIQGSVGGTGGGTDFEKKHPDLAGKM